jgi:hypothetical protein
LEREVITVSPVFADPAEVDGDEDTEAEDDGDLDGDDDPDGAGVGLALQPKRSANISTAVKSRVIVFFMSNS